MKTNIIITQPVFKLAKKNKEGFYLTDLSHEIVADENRIQSQSEVERKIIL